GEARRPRTSRCCRTSSPVTRWRTWSRSWARWTRSSARSTGNDHERRHAERALLRPPTKSSDLAGPAPMTLPPVAQHALEAFVVLNAVILMVTYVTLLERKFAARMQSRIGPYYVGRPHGWLQPIADALKLMIKEDIVPAAADRGVYNLAPVVFLVPCMLIFATIPAENRVPFDILEAESELVAGFRVEYSGMKFALIQLGEYAHMLGTSFLGALLFLGGWLGPGPAWLGPLWFLGKALLVFLVVTWVRWSFVRIRVDQILAISWKLLLPATLVLLLATGLVVATRGAGGV